MIHTGLKAPETKHTENETTYTYLLYYLINNFAKAHCVVIACGDIVCQNTVDKIRWDSSTRFSQTKQAELPSEKVLLLLLKSFVRTTV